MAHTNAPNVIANNITCVTGMIIIINPPNNNTAALITTSFVNTCNDFSSNSNFFSSASISWNVSIAVFNTLANFAIPAWEGSLMPFINLSITANFFAVLANVSKYLPICMTLLISFLVMSIISGKYLPISPLGENSIVNARIFVSIASTSSLAANASPLKFLTNSVITFSTSSIFIN